MMINFQVIRSNAIILLGQENPLHHSKPRLGQPQEAEGGPELVTGVTREKQTSPPSSQDRSPACAGPCGLTLRPEAQGPSGGAPRARPAAF